MLNFARSRRIAVVVGLALAGAGLALGIGIDSGAGDAVNLPQGPPPRVTSVETLGQLARLEASLAGGDAGVRAEYGTTTRQTAVAAVDGSRVDEVAAARPVYVVVMHGQFTLNNVPRPPGAPAPSGAVLTLVVDQEAGVLSDIGLTRQDPRLPPAVVLEALPLPTEAS